MNEELASYINKVSDEVVDDYFENHLIIFESDSEKKKEYYKTLSIKQKRWTKQQKCIVKGCCEKSIKRSHTIQRSGPLFSVSRNSLVYTPEHDYKTGRLILRNRGISEASVFPGFCCLHEKMFSAFEESKNLLSEKSIALQIYRTICRELFRLSVELEMYKKHKDEYTQFRDRKFLSMMKLKLTDKWMRENNVSFKDFTLRDDYFLRKLDENIKDLTDIYEEIESNHLCELEKAITNGVESSLCAYVINIDVLLPVALSGFGSFYPSKDRRVLIFAGIYPNVDKKETCISFYSSEEDKPYLDSYLGEFTTNLDLLNIIERFMIRATDHWFIDPQVWDDMSDQKKDKILSEILIREKGINFPLDFSIFDSLRSEIIRHAESLDLSEREIEKLELEKEKLNM